MPAVRPGSAGTTGGKAKVAEAGRTIRMTLRHPDRDAITRRFRPNAVPIRERLIVRKVTSGIPFEAFMPDENGFGVGVDTMQIWWFLAKRGENPMATFDQAMAEWPDEITEDTFDVVVEGGDDEDPTEDLPEG